MCFNGGMDKRKTHPSTWDTHLQNRIQELNQLPHPLLAHHFTMLASNSRAYDRLTFEALMRVAAARLWA